MNDTILTFNWDLLGPEYYVDNYTITVSSSPLFNPRSYVDLSPPFNVTLAHNKFHLVKIAAVNCAGTGETFVLPVIEFSKLHWHVPLLLYIVSFIFCETVSCGVPIPPMNGMVMNYSLPIEGANITFRCNDGFRPSVVVTSTCIDTTEWIPSPNEYNCTSVTGKQMYSYKSVSTFVLLQFVQQLSLLVLSNGMCQIMISIVQGISYPTTVPSYLTVRHYI